VLEGEFLMSRSSSWRAFITLSGAPRRVTRLLCYSDIGIFIPLHNNFNLQLFLISRLRYNRPNNVKSDVFNPATVIKEGLCAQKLSVYS
jgi:hypothetical protein